MIQTIYLSFSLSFTIFGRGRGEINNIIWPYKSEPSLDIIN